MKDRKKNNKKKSIKPIWCKLVKTKDGLRLQVVRKPKQRNLHSG